jgi:hypothetical protein
VDDRSKVKLLRGERGETFAHRETSLCTKDRDRPCAGAVAFGLALIQNQPQKIKILNHASPKPNQPTTLGRERALLEFGEDGLGGAGGCAGFAELGGDLVEAVEDSVSLGFVLQQAQAGFGEVFRGGL